jgi:hypothetical protein
MRRNNFDISTIIMIASVLGLGSGFFGVYYYFKHAATAKLVTEANQMQLEAVKVPIFTPTTTPKIKTHVATTTPNSAFNLDVAFFPQAPKKMWDAAHEDYCEEASLLGVDAFLKHKTYSLDEMESMLSKMREWEVKTFGYFESTSVEQVERIAREYLGYKKVRIIDNPTLDMIRAEVSAGHPVIVPANGKELKNPYFKNGGPMFHMYVVRGFTESGDVIVNDPGTQHGENFVYKKEVVLSSMHDWNHTQDITKEASGVPRVLVLE